MAGEPPAEPSAGSGSDSALAPSSDSALAPPSDSALAPLAVTTAYRALPEMRVRAAEVAQRCSAPLVPRESLSKMRQVASLIYVVGRQEEFVFSPAGRLVAGEGLMKLKKLDGPEHPLVRAVAPGGSRTTTVFDGTLGLAQDALHVSLIGGVSVDGVEASPALVCLVENFLDRAGARWGDAPRRIHPRTGLAYDVLRTLDDDAYDVVYFDPMFDVAMPSQPDFRVLRSLAREQPLTQDTLDEAVRVARQRVVLKVRTLAAPSIEPPAPGWNRRVSGRAFNYWIVEKALDDPVLEPLRVKYSWQKLRYLGLM